MGKVKDRKRRAKAAKLRQSRQAKEGTTKNKLAGTQHLQDRIDGLLSALTEEQALTTILTAALEEVHEVTAKSRSKDAKAAHEIVARASVAIERLGK